MPTNNTIAVDFTPQPKQVTDLALPLLPPQNWSLTNYMLCGVFHRSWQPVRLPDTARGAHCSCCNRSYWWNSAAKNPAESIRRAGKALARQFTQGMG